MIKYLIEIKNRLILVLLSSFFSVFICYLYKEIFLFLLLKPVEILKDKQSNLVLYFIFTDITEIFYVYLNLIFFITIQCFIIFLIYHIFNFFCYALYKKEYYFCLTLLKLCFFMWIIALILSKFFLIPLSWEFFSGFKRIISTRFITVYFEPKIYEYLNFCITFYYICIFYCQFFSILFFFMSYYISNFIFIKKFRKFYYYSFVIFSTTISPPDIFSQLFISFFLIFLFEILIVIFIFKKKLVW